MSSMGFQLAYLHLILTQSDGQGQGHALNMFMLNMLNMLNMTVNMFEIMIDLVKVAIAVK